MKKKVSKAKGKPRFDLRSSVHGMGINDHDTSIKDFNGQFLKSYEIWKGLLRSCFSCEFRRKHPSLEGSTICDEWLLFSNFKRWFDDNYRYDLVCKDVSISINSTILNENGEKLYSPETCIFIPLSVQHRIVNKKDRPTAKEIKNIKKYLRKLGGYDEEFLSKIS